jgi:toxin ParE1/3/4
LTKYIIAPEASRDLDEISNYYAIHNIEAGEKLIGQIENKCKYLVSFPNIGRSYRTIRPYLRGLSCLGYIIFYRVSDDYVEILRVVNGNRDLELLFSED